MSAYAGLAPRDQIAADIAATPFRCDACSECVRSVRWHDLPGGTRFQLCRDCADLHSAVPVPGGDVDMNSKFFEENWNDADGNPAGGTAWGNGFAISWQNGPLGRCSCPVTHLNGPDGTEAQDHARCGRRQPNGAFVEDIISAAAARLKYYQHSAFRCGENEMALGHLYAALQVLNSRTSRREAAKTEGTHEGP